MPRKTLIKNAQCLFPDETVEANVLLDGTRIASVDAPATSGADEIVEARGLLLMPGLIDDQVHFRDPGLTHKEDLHTGSLACARGGVTTFLEMPNTNPPTVDRGALERKLALAASKSVVNFGFYIGATVDNVEELAKAERTPGIKIFIGSSTGDLLVDEQEALERIFEGTTLPICAHCEDEQTVRRNAAALSGGREVADHSRIRNHEAALIATKRAVELAVRHRHPFHVLHVSTGAEVEFLRDAHQNLITAEACPHHLLFSLEDYDRLGSLVQMNPSIKTAADKESLWRGLTEGVLQVVATDHAPHTWEEKQRPYPESPSGLPAVENSLSLMLQAHHDGRCSLRQILHWMCEAPARVWNLLDKGRIAPDFDADLVLVDLEEERVVRNAEQVTKCGWSPWDGVTLRGGPVRTWVRGKTVFQNGRLDPEVRGEEVRFDPGRGGYWATSPRS